MDGLAESLGWLELQRAAVGSDKARASLGMKALAMFLPTKPLEILESF